MENVPFLVAKSRSFQTPPDADVAEFLEVQTFENDESQVEAVQNDDGSNEQRNESLKHCQVSDNLKNEENVSQDKKKLLSASNWMPTGPVELIPN